MATVACDLVIIGCCGGHDGGCVVCGGSGLCITTHRSTIGIGSVNRLWGLYV